MGENRDDVQRGFCLAWRRGSSGVRGGIPGSPCRAKKDWPILSRGEVTGSEFWEVTLVALVCEYRAWLLAAAGRASSPVRERACTASATGRFLSARHPVGSTEPEGRCKILLGLVLGTRLRSMAAKGFGSTSLWCGDGRSLGSSLACRIRCRCDLRGCTVHTAVGRRVRAATHAPAMCSAS